MSRPGVAGFSGLRSEAIMVKALCFQRRFAQFIPRGKIAMIGTNRVNEAMLFGLVLWLAVPAVGEETTLPAKEKLHVYLLMGQSNMAGRGVMTDADRQPVARVLMLDKQDRWVPAAHPLHFDKPIAGVGLGMSFAKAMAAEDPTITIGLVPCAVGGTPLARWCRDGDLYQRAIARAKVAMQSGTLCGALWHQGEADSGRAATADTYASRLDQMIRDLRTDLQSPNLPFVAGGLGEFFIDRAGRNANVLKVNEALADLPNRVEQTGFASAQGLDHKGDRVHFNSDAFREFGKRYAAQMQRLGAK